MAKQNMKKLMAVTLAMSMCWSTLSVQAFAAEASAEDATPGVNITVSGDGTAESPTVTVTVTETTEGNKTTTETDTEWTGETKTESETGDGEDDGTVTTVTGEESKVETETVDRKDRPTQQTGKVEGEETTKTETTETEVKEDQVIGTDTDDIDTTKTETGETSDVKWEEDGDGDTDHWVEGETEFGNWTPTTENTTEGAGKDGWKTTTEPTKTTTEELDIPDPLAGSGEIELNLKPGKSDSEKKTVSTKTILAANGDMFDLALMEQLKKEGGKIETTEGHQTIVKEAIYGEKGAVIGYTITTTTFDADPGVTDEIQTSEVREGESGYETKVIAPEIPDTWADDLNTVGEVTETTDGDKVTKTATSEKGVKVEMTKEPIYEEGTTNIIGYTITKTTTTPNHDVDTYEATGETTTENAPTETQFQLPAKPAESEKTEDGVTTKVVVEDVYDADGNHVGYKAITTEIKNGKVYKTGTETIYGTTTTVNKTTVTDPTTKKVTTDTTTVTTEVTTIYGYTQTSDVNVTQTQTTTGIKTTEVTETEAYQFVETDGGKYFLYKGKMYEVVAAGDHGDLATATLQPQMGLTPSADATVDYSTMLRNPHYNDSGYDEDDISSGYEFIYDGYGLETAIRVNKNYETYGENGSGDVLAHQFKLIGKDGTAHYVLCADLGTNAVRGAVYNMENVNSANYYQRDGAAAKIEVIALSGYWGTADGIGSLENVKQLLREAKAAGKINLSNTEIENMTPGEALTATQAAIWYYGNSDAGKNMHAEAITGRVLNNNGYYWSNGSQVWYTDAATADQANTVNTLYQVLIGIDPAAVNNNTTDVINTNDFAQNAAIIIKDKTDADVNKDDNKDNDEYNTDLQFTLAVTPGANDTLIVQVIQDGKVVETKRLAGDDTTTNYGTIQQVNGVYTIEDIQLTENVAITLNLEGVQHLNQGVYLYTAAVYSTSQTFVGVASGERDVNLNVNMEFEVEEPTAKQKTTKDKTTKTKTETTTNTRTGTREDTREGITEKSDTTTTTTGTETTVVYADVTVTEVTETETLREWAEEWLENFKYPSKPTIPEEPDTPDVPEEIIDIPDEEEEEEEVPLDEIPEELIKPEEEPQIIPSEEEVPLNDVPKTGDMSALWYGLTLLSGGGILGLLTGRKGKKEL